MSATIVRASIWGRVLATAVLAVVTSSLGGCSCASKMWLSPSELSSTRMELEPRDVSAPSEPAEPAQVAWCGRMTEWESPEHGIARFEYLRAPPTARRPGTAGSGPSTDLVRPDQLVATGERFRVLLRGNAASRTERTWPRPGDVVLVIGPVTNEADVPTIRPPRGVVYDVRIEHPGRADDPAWLIHGVSEGRGAAHRAGTPLLVLCVEPGDAHRGTAIDAAARIRSVVGPSGISVCVVDSQFDRFAVEWRRFPQVGIHVGTTAGKRHFVPLDPSQPAAAVDAVVAVLRGDTDPTGPARK